MKIRDYEIGIDGVYVIAEACSNHAGSLKNAKKLIDMAAEAGADAVKFQRFRITELAKTNQYKPALLDRLKPLELSDNWLPILRDRAHEKGLAFIVTPFDGKSVYALAPYVDAWKLRHTDWDGAHHAEPWVSLKKRGEEKQPYICSVPAKQWKGACSEEDAVTLYCPEQYPTPLDDLHLPDFTCFPPTPEPIWENGYRYHQGFSDHTISLMTGALAVARGAEVIEKHFMLASRRQEYYDKIVDAQVSLTPGRLYAYILNIRNAEKAIRPKT